LVSVSVGVSSGRPSESLTGSWLLQAADQALYRCKGELGRNTVACAPSHDS
jgi:PleD family two-component response regulator